MAHFYGDLQGNRGMATRMGTAESGISGHIRGWKIGSRVVMSTTENNNEDEVIIEITGGSNGGFRADIAQIKQSDIQLVKEGLAKIIPCQVHRYTNAELVIPRLAGKEAK